MQKMIILDKEHLNIPWGVLKVYESFTDEEYDKSNCMSYSIIKDIQDNPEILTKERTKSTKEWLIFGTLVDMLLTQPFEAIEEKIIINNSVPSDQYIKISNYIINNNLLPNKLIGDIAKFSDDLINEIYNNSGSQVNWKVDTKKEKIINECGDYIELILNQGDKIIVTTDLFNEATKVAELFSHHQWTKNLFFNEEQQRRHNIEIYYQYKIKYIYEGITCKSKIDIVLVDHDKQLIYLYDIKTGSDNIREFIKNAIYKYKYGYQGVLYTEGFKAFISKMLPFKDYKLSNFRFVYVNRLKPTYPIILQMDSSCHKEFRDLGIQTELYNLPSLQELFEEADYYIKAIDSGETNIEPFDPQRTFGEFVINSTTKNNIYF